jgi:hypothetical protein
MFKHFSNPQNISYQTLIDAMELSGYAYIYSIIYKKPNYWISAKAAWAENFLPTKQNIELLATYFSYYEKELLGSGINFNEKHQRELILANVVGRLGLKPDDVDDWLVKPFIKESFLSSYFDVPELFIEIYLFTFLESKSATELIRREFFEEWCRNIDNPNLRNNDDFGD